MKLFDLFKKVIKKEEDDSYEFKPLLAEIEEAPMNPIGNTVFWIIISFIFISSLWMYFAKVDVVVTARGLVIPTGEEKIIKSLDKGVATISVMEGEFVTKGQIVAIVTPAEYEPGLELNNIREEESKIVQQLADANSKYKIALDTKNRLESVKDIIPQSRYDDALKEVIELSHNISALSSSLAEIKNKRIQIEKQKQTLKSPIDGYINKIMVHTTGEVVTPAQEIMTIVPKDASMQIKAKILNQDVGFIEPNMPVSIKVDTYNFQKYGILEGIVTIISPNSIKDEQMGDIYEVYIEPQNTTLIVEGKEQTIKYGMTTTNEIKIGKRRIIEFFIYPLIKYLDESIKVR